MSISAIRGYLRAAKFQLKYAREEHSNTRKGLQYPESVQLDLEIAALQAQLEALLGRAKSVHAAVLRREGKSEVQIARATGFKHP